MFNRPRVCIGALALCTLLGSYANASSTISHNKTVTKIKRYTNYAIVTFDPAQANAEGCTKGGDTMVLIEWSTNDANRDWAATALTAFVSGKYVGFGVTGCYNDYPKVYRMTIAE